MRTSFPYFIARRIHSQGAGSKGVSRPAVNIATAGVAIGLAVMIITVSVVLGFKHTIRDKVVGFGCHIQVSNFLSAGATDPVPICIDDSVMRVLRSVGGVSHCQRFGCTTGILKTDDDFLGIAFKGVAREYDMSFLRSCLTAGDIPEFSDSASHYKLLVSETTASKLHLKVGSKVFAYFISQVGVRTRRFTVCGIFNTNMSHFDEQMCITDLALTRRLNNWQDGQCSGAELQVADYSQLDDVADRVSDRVNRTADHYGDTFTSQTAAQAYPQIFSWLSLLDINVWIILALMICVAGFTIVSGLLIIILERTQMIGVLKALGSPDSQVRHIFLWFAAFIISRGLLIGDAVGLGLVLAQRQWGFVSLDPQTYYVDSAPVEINVPLIVALNVVTLAVSMFVLIAPSYLVAHIHPARSMRYE